MTSLLAAAQPGVPGAELAAAAALALPIAAWVLLAGTRVRRRHLRLPDTTAAEAERLAWGSTAVGRTAVAVSVVPRRVPDTLPPGQAPPPAAGADLDDVIGRDHPVSAPGRHRTPGVLPALLRVRPWTAADDDEEEDPSWSSAEGAGAAPVMEPEPGSGSAAEPEQVPTPVAEADPAPRRPLRSWVGRSPSPTMRRRVRQAGRRLASASDPATAARLTVDEALALADADWAALVVRSVDGPRVLALAPAGPQEGRVWGSSTLQALLDLDAPLRDLLPGDPLADGDTTALLVVPVPSLGAVSGSLLVRRHEARTFSPVDEDVLARLARMTGRALHGSGVPTVASAPSAPSAVPGQRRASEPLAGVDPGADPAARVPHGATAWTPEPDGLGGRDRLLADMAAAARTTRSHGRPAALIVAHVDGVDRLRTVAGDRPADESSALLTQAVVRTLRVGDVPYRLSRDRLAVLLPATAVDLAGPVAERLRDAVEQSLDAARRSAVLPSAVAGVTLRTAVEALEGDADDVLAQAERALDAALRVAQREREHPEVALPAVEEGAV